jgi:hypothetical protein
VAANLRGLSSVEPCDDTEIAQRFLASAYDAVAGVLQSLDSVREYRKAQEGGKPLRRLTGPEEDLLRAAVVFACAGLDATLKQLIRDALPPLLATNPAAHDKFEAFVRSEVSRGENVDAERLARYLVSANPRSRLIEQYIYELTGSSLQSAQEVDRAAGALGIDNSVLRKRIKAMQPIFVARNEISHELDLQEIQKPGDRTRRSRTMKQATDLAHEALEIAQLLVNEVGDFLNEHTPKGDE